MCELKRSNDFFGWWKRIHRGTRGRCHDVSQTLELCMRKAFLVTLIASVLSTGAVASAPAVRKEPLDATILGVSKSKFGRLMELANKHDFKALHEMFWQSPSSLLLAKSLIQSEGSWAGFWGNEAIDQKLHDIGSSGPGCSNQIIRSPGLSG
jgi:hypothetical protein